MQVEIEFVLALRAARGPIQQCDPAVCAAKAPGSQELLETTNYCAQGHLSASTDCSITKLFASP